MKTPVILKVFAVFNLLIALAGLFIGAAATIDFIDNYIIWNRQIVLSSYIIICSAWLLFASLSWFLGFRSAYSLLIISALSIFSFFIGVLNYAFEVGITSKGDKVGLSVLIIGFSVYALFMLSSLLSKQVKDWKALNPEMKKSMMPMLLIFCVITYGNHAAIKFGVPDSIANGTEEESYNESEAWAEEETAEEYYDDGSYPDEEYYEEEYEGEYEEGDYDFYNEEFEVSDPINTSKTYPSHTNGKTISNTDINKMLLSFINAFSANEWIYNEAFKEDNALMVSNGTREFSIGNFHLGMASIYEIVNPYFTKNLDLLDKENCYSKCYLKEVSGINPILISEENNDGFNKYNPEIIKWMYTELIPEPTDNFLNDIMARQLYGKVFRRFFRIYTQAYCYIKTNDFNGEMETYSYQAGLEDFYGPSYLYERYNGAIRTEYDGSLEPTSAIGFWLRRGMDGTDDECWNGIQKVMNQYDAKWFSNIKEAYNIE